MITKIDIPIADLQREPKVSAGPVSAIRTLTVDEIRRVRGGYVSTAYVTATRKAGKKASDIINSI